MLDSDIDEEQDILLSDDNDNNMQSLIVSLATKSKLHNINMMQVWLHY